MFFRFNVPSRIVDSTTVVRASLLLTQMPNRLLNPRESIYVFPVPVLARPAVTNIRSRCSSSGRTASSGSTRYLGRPGRQRRSVL